MEESEIELELGSRLELWAVLLGLKQVINCGSESCRGSFVFNALINGEPFKTNLPEWKGKAA